MPRALQGVLDLPAGFVAADQADGHQGAVHRRARAAGGDDVAVDDHGFVNDFHIGQVEVVQGAGETRGATSGQQAMGGQDTGGGTYRGDPAFPAVVFDQKPFQAIIGGQVVRAGQAAGQADQVEGFPVTFDERFVGLNDGPTAAGDRAFPDPGYGDPDVCPPQQVDEGNGLELFETRCKGNECGCHGVSWSTISGTRMSLTP